MVESFSDSHPLIWIELQRALKKVLHIWGDELKDLTERLAFTMPKRFYVVLCTLIANKIDIFGSADYAKNDGSK